MRLHVKHVKRTRSKGRTYYYHRLTGERLPDDPAAAAARAHAINEELPGDREPPAPHMLASVIAAYKASSKFTQLADRTRKEYGGHLDFLGATFGDLRVTDVDRPFVLELHEQLSATPRAANYVIQVLRIVLGYAVDRGLVEFNAASKPELFKSGEGYRSWPETAIKRFRRDADAELVWAMEIGWHTALRGGDCVRLGWQNWKGSGFNVTTAKNGIRLWIPALPELQAVVAAIPRRAVCILTTKTGRIWTESHFRNSFHAAVVDCGMGGLTFHGLRHSRGAALAEAGCTEKEIMAVMGHQSAAMATHYTEGADQRRLAESAIAKLARGG